MKENFSKRVQTIMKFAKEEAIRLGHSYVGSEHLLLGILRGGKGMSIKILDIFDCDIISMCAMVEDMIKASGGTMTVIMTTHDEKAASIGSEKYHLENGLLHLLTK